ncbi:MAG: S-methyl-5-thioribose-1-phosphate isomerase [Caldisericota bacterium]|nr:S-methyl-5-thioribose-1-phosphate isomerase [Caldisericota bacterium]
MVSLKFKGETLYILDQRKLPFEFVNMPCKTKEDIWEAINKMMIRGAPAIGVTAAYGMYLGAKDLKEEKFFQKLNKIKKYLDSARPTAVNLKWATERIYQVAEKNKGKTVNTIKRLILKEAKILEKEDSKQNLNIGKYGSTLFSHNDIIMTICNTGALATVAHGTAFSVIRRSFEKYKNISVIALETRPYLQGARLTALELKEAKIPFHLITDNMSGFMMAKNLVNGIVVGADRIASNGDTANKIGTYTLAVLARYHKIPFYVVAPTSTIDPNISGGADIPIEERNPDEVTHCGGKRIAPEKIKVYNPAFDVTPNKFIDAIVTEKGILRKPFRESIKRILK